MDRLENKEILDEIFSLTNALSNHGISVEQILYNSGRDATLILGSIKVYLGNSDQMDEKITELKSQLPVLDGLSGTLYLDTYDEAETAASYRFVKNK